MIIGKKLIFDSCWRNEVSNFHLRKFERVGPFCELNEADVDINTVIYSVNVNISVNSCDISGANETMQKARASIV